MTTLIGFLQGIADRVPKPSITPEIVERFRAFKRHDVSLFHVVLDNGNTEDKFAMSTLVNACALGDAEAIKLAQLLVAMSRTQRTKLGRMVG